MRLSDDIGTCLCCWQVEYKGRTFQISADFNGQADLTGSRFKRISGPGFWFNKRSIKNLKKELAKQIMPACGCNCPLINDDN